MKAAKGRTGWRVRLVLIDDHAVFREGTRALLAGEPDLDVMGEAAKKARHDFAKVCVLAVAGALAMWAVPAVPKVAVREGV